ncbi:MAG: hypothetical protein JSS22_07860 [Proteobacteria bacterium]|nr:hypothetical protein [Pseudomonadota bacterium]
MTRYWFKPKRYGYGATPVTWPGWCITAAFVLVLVAFNVTLRLTEKQDWALVALFAFDAIAVATFVMICRRKTDGEWHWRWGAKDNA